MLETMDGRLGVSELLVAEPNCAPRVIVVDDDVTLQRVLGPELHREGYEVHFVPTAQAALQMEPYAPSLIILDVRGAPGAAPAAIARLREHCEGLPIIALSSSRDALEWADRLKVDAFLSKPFDLHRLLLMVDVLVQRWRDGDRAYDGAAL